MTAQANPPKAAPGPKAPKAKKKAVASTFDKRLKLLLTPCKTRDELYKFIQYFFGLSLPDCTVSRYADTNPFDVIWQIYDICVNKNNPMNHQEILCVAGRGSGKTLGMAILELVIMLHDQRDVCHVGAILSQAKRCYEYQVKFMLNEKIKPLIDPPHLHKEDRVLQKMNMEKSMFLVDKQQVSLEVLPCTLKACNGPHVPLVVVDEIDTVSGEGVKAFKEITGMLDSKGGKKALRVGISTRKSRYGLMNAQIENAEAEGRTVWRWTAFEFTEQCSDERSGIAKVPYYIIQDNLEVINEEQWLLKDKKKQKEYERYEMYEKCGSCPIAAICLGDAKKQVSKSPMLKPLDELIKKVRSEGADWALAQLMNLKPSVEGIVFKEYDEKIHVKDWNGMWEKLTGQEFPGECTHDIFVKKCQQMGLPCYAGVDWGWSNPSTVVYFYIDKKDNVYVVRADGMTYLSQPEWVHYMKMRYHSMYRCQMYFPDVADQGAIVEMRKAGLPAASEVDKNINTGIQIIKKLLRVPGAGVAESKICMAKETCSPLMNEFTMYHFKTDAAGMITEDPESANDHWLDALRYPLTMLLGKSTLIGGEGLNIAQDSITDNNGNFHKMPTPGEFAKTQNIQFSEEADTSKLGKIGKVKDLDGDDDDWNGGGGFLWSI